MTGREQIIEMKDKLEGMPSGLHIKYMSDAFSVGKELTEDRLNRLIQEIREGKSQGVYLTQTLYPEENYMQIEVDKGLVFIQYIENAGLQKEHFYSSFNPAYLDSEEESPLRCSDGQSIILTRYTMQDLKLAAKCVEYFARTGKLLSLIHI